MIQVAYFPQIAVYYIYILYIYTDTYLHIIYNYIIVQNIYSFYRLQTPRVTPNIVSTDPQGTPYIVSVPMVKEGRAHYNVYIYIYICVCVSLSLSLSRVHRNY